MKLFLVAMAVGAVVVIAPGARAQTPTTVTAAIGSNMNHVPSFVGVEKGIFLKQGIARERVTLLNVMPGNTVSTLQGGSVDAVAVWEPYGSLVGAKVPDAQLVARGGGYVGYYINISVRNDIIDKDPQLVERFVL